MPKKRSKKGKGFDTDKLLSAVGAIQQSGLVGNVAGIIDPRAGQIIRSVGYGKKKGKKGGSAGSNLRLMPVGRPPMFVENYKQNLGSGKKLKKGKGWADVVSGLVNLPLSASAGTLMGLSGGINAGLHAF